MADNVQLPQLDALRGYLEEDVEEAEVRHGRGLPEYEAAQTRLFWYKRMGIYYFVFRTARSMDEMLGTDAYCHWFDESVPENPLKWGYGRRLLRSEFVKGLDLVDLVRVVPEDGVDPLPNLEVLFRKCLAASITKHPPPTILELARADPKLAFWNFGMAGGILAGLIGTGLAFLPRRVLRYPCLWLGFPDPDEYQAQIASNNGWVSLRLSTSLFESFRITKKDITQIEKG